MVAKRYLRDGQPLKDQVDETKLKDAVLYSRPLPIASKRAPVTGRPGMSTLQTWNKPKHQTMAQLDIYIKDLVRRCQFNQTEQESHKTDLLYHATAHFEVMNYSNPLLQTSALLKSFQKGPPKKTFGKCGCSHNHSECPTHGTTCSICGKKNHWAQQCRSSRRRHSSSGHSPSPEGPQKQRDRRFNGKQFNKGRGWGGGNGNKNNSTPKRPGAGWGCGGKPHKTFSLTVADVSSGPPHPPKVTGPRTEVVSIKADLSRLAHPPKTTGEQFINIFACDALRDKGNEEYSLPSNKGKTYTDTNSAGKIDCKFQGKLVVMEVKVDPGSKIICIWLSHFRHLFPQLCSEDGNPRENVLEPTLAQFEAYDGGILQAHRWIILPTRDIRDKKFHPVRYYVVDREEVRILISHATATWLGLVKVLCPNKAPKIKRQVASVSKKAKKPLDQNNNNFLSGPQHPLKVKYSLAAPQHPPKEKYSQTVMVKQQQNESPTSQPHSHRRRHCRGKPAHGEVYGQLDHQPVKSHSFQIDSNGATRVQSGQSVSPYSTTTPSQSTIKPLSNNHYCSSTFRTTTPSQSEILGFLPKWQYYQPQEDQETYYINSEGHLQCHQDPQNTITAATPQELPRSKEHPIYHKPGSIKVSSTKDLLKLS